MRYNINVRRVMCMKCVSRLVTMKNTFLIENQLRKVVDLLLLVIISISVGCFAHGNLFTPNKFDIQTNFKSKSQFWDVTTI